MARKCFSIYWTCQFKKKKKVQEFQDFSGPRLATCVISHRNGASSAHWELHTHTHTGYSLVSAKETRKFNNVCGWHLGGQNIAGEGEVESCASIENHEVTTSGTNALWSTILLLQPAVAQGHKKYWLLRNLKFRYQFHTDKIQDTDLSPEVDKYISHFKTCLLKLHFNNIFSFISEYLK